MAKNPTTLNAGTVNPSRRRFFGTTVTGLGGFVVVGALPRFAFADDLPHQTLDDPTAKALNYTEDASKAPAPHVAGQTCANCNFYQGAATGFGPCQLFPGKSVNAKGWCSGYAKKA